MNWKTDETNIWSSHTEVYIPVFGVVLSVTAEIIPQDTADEQYRADMIFQHLGNGTNLCKDFDSISDAADWCKEQHDQFFQSIHDEVTRIILHT